MTVAVAGGEAWSPLDCSTVTSLCMGAAKTPQLSVQEDPQHRTGCTCCHGLLWSHKIHNYYSQEIFRHACVGAVQFIE